MITLHRRLSPALFGAALALLPAALHAAPCSPAPQVLCLGAGSRFQAEVTWTAPGRGTGKGQAVPLTNDTGLFWFFEEENLELMVKVLDGRQLNGHFWIYFGSLSNVAYTLTVKDTQTGAQEVFQNPAGRFYSGSNTSAFLPEEAPRAAAKAVAELAAAEPVRRGPEIAVNQTTLGMQRRPDVAVAPDGSFLVVWEGTPGANATYDVEVYARLYDAEGRPLSNEVRVNGPGAGKTERRPRVAASPLGGFMVVWEENGRVAGRMVDAAGQPFAGELSFPTGGGSQPDVAADFDGGYLVVWRQPVGGTYDSSQIHGQPFDSRGNPSGGDALIGLDGVSPTLASLAGGGFVVIWTEGSVVNVRRLYFSGQPNGPTLQVNDSLSPQTGFLTGAVPVAHPDGNFSVLWGVYPPFQNNPASHPGVFARRYTKGSPGLAVPIHPTRNLDFDNPAAISLPSGETWVVWTEWNATSGDLQAALFGPDWNPLSDPTTVNTYTDKEQREPALGRTGDQIVAVWTSGVDYSPILPPGGYGEDTQDGSFYGVFGQRFSAEAAPEPTCAAASNQLCLRGRFRVEVSFTSPWTGQPTAGQPVPLTADTGAFWFFQPANVELMIKVLDGRLVNDHFWVYFGALSDVEYTITVTDTLTDKVKTYYNAPKTQASRADSNAF